MLKIARPWAISLPVLSAVVCSSVTSRAQIPSPTPQASPLSLPEALRLANAQASAFQTALLSERIAAEDVRQARAAFLPRVSTPLSYVYTSPALGLSAGEPRGPSFVSADGIGVYDALVNVSGDFDIAGRLRATLARNRALLAAAHAGAEVARRQLAQGVIETYYGLALATAQLRTAETNLDAAKDFEHITSLLKRLYVPSNADSSLNRYQSHH